MKRENYHSYLLRVWLVKDSRKSVWRGSLENPFTGERKGFANLRELFIFLTIRIGEIEPNPDEMSE